MSNDFLARVIAAARAATAAALIATGVAGGAAGTAVALAVPAVASPAAQTEATATVFGQPDLAAHYWQMQHLADNCVLMSVADVVGQVTGNLPSEEEIVTLAENTPSAMHPGSIYIRPKANQTWGTDPSDVVVLLAHYGIRGAVTNAATEDQTGVPTGLLAIERYLGDGHKVIATVNVETIWDSPEGDRTAPDHSLVVTGVDTRNATVHLNDPAYPSGANKQVSIATFMQAWRASDCEMVVTVNDN
ncbi:C39 family peptidase [Mycobacterium basiliense]|uniref:C39 family peptidase n=1 Tax=Mycobacterium basiliense TaxID=2094119 RepID=UPI0013018744